MQSNLSGRRKVEGGSKWSFKDFVLFFVCSGGRGEGGGRGSQSVCDTVSVRKKECICVSLCVIRSVWRKTRGCR